MKKIITCLLICFLIVSISSCKKKDDNQDDQKNDKATVVFYSDNVVYKSEELLIGASVNEPTDEPSKVGYLFRNWYYDEQLTQIVTFPFELEKDTAIYAGFRKSSPNRISFETNGSETECVDIIQYEGSTIQLPSPQKSGYLFSGWYLDKELTNKFTDTKMPGEDIILYAGFVKDENVSKLTIDYGFYKDEVLVSKDNSSYNLNFSLENYILDYWEDEEGNQIESPLTVDKDMTIKCCFHSSGLLVRKGILTSYTGSSTIVVLSNDIKVVGNGSNPFEDSEIKNNITQIYLNKDVKEIGDDAFAGLTGLEYIYIPETIELIGENVFYGCSSLKKLDFKGNVKYPFENNMLLSETKDTVIKYVGVAEELSIPSTITTIAANAFAYSQINKLIIPESVNKLDDYAFVGSKVSEVELNASVNAIPDYSFKDCQYLTKITIGKAIKEILSFAFSNCEKLNKVIFTNTEIVNVDQYAFEKCVSLETIDFSKIQIVDGTVFSFAGIKSYTVSSDATSIPSQMFVNWTNLTKIEIPATVKEIGEKAFLGCSSLKDVVIPKNNAIEKIGQSAFEKCGLETLDLSSCDKLTHIDTYAFANCLSLKTIVLPDNLYIIGERVLQGCSSIENITIPFIGSYSRLGVKEMFDDMIAGYPGKTPEEVLNDLGMKIYNSCLNQEDFIEYVTSEIFTSEFLFGRLFGYNEFDNATECFQYYSSESYYAAYIPNSIKSVTITGEYVSAYAFNGISNFTNQIKLSPNVKVIGCKAFYNCKNLSEMIIPDGVTTIKEQAFAIDTSLNSIAFPDTVNYIGEKAFLACYELVDVKLPNNKNLVVGQNIFSDCKKISSVYQNADDKEEYTVNLQNGSYNGYLSFDNDTIKTVIIGNDVSFVCEQYPKTSDPFNGFFNSLNELVDVYLPNELNVYFNDKKVDLIPSNFFGGCVNLEHIYIDGYQSEKDVTLPRNIKMICYSAFREVGKNKGFTIDIPECLDTIASSAFLYSGLQSIDCRNVVNYYGRSKESNPNEYYNCSDAFGYCEQLSSIILSNKITEIYNSMFSACSVLETIGIYNPDTDTLLYEEGKIYLPTDILKIGDGAFFGCLGIRELTIPSLVEAIDARAFYQTSNLTKIVIPANVTSINNMAFTESGIASVEFLGKNVKTFGDSVFRDCKNLTSVSFPEGVVSIGGYIFAGCANLEYVSIPSTCQEFGRTNGFADCLKLKTIVIHAITPPNVDGGNMRVQTLFFNTKTGNRINNMELKERGLKIYVPAESYKLYTVHRSTYGIYTRTITGWKEYVDLLVPMTEGLYTDGVKSLTLSYDGNSNYVEFNKGFSQTGLHKIEINEEDNSFAFDNVNYKLVMEDKSLSKVIISDGTSEEALIKVTGSYLDLSSSLDKVGMDTDGDKEIDTYVDRPTQFRHALNIFADGTCKLTIWANGNENTQPSGSSAAYCLEIVAFTSTVYEGSYTIMADGTINLTVENLDNKKTINLTIKDGISSAFELYGSTYVLSYSTFAEVI